MSNEHKRPMVAFFAVVVICGVLLANASRGNATELLRHGVIPAIVAGPVLHLADTAAAAVDAEAVATPEPSRAPATEPATPATKDRDHRSRVGRHPAAGTAVAGPEGTPRGDDRGLRDHDDPGLTPDHPCSGGCPDVPGESGPGTPTDAPAPDPRSDHGHGDHHGPGDRHGDGDDGWPDDGDDQGEPGHRDHRHHGDHGDDRDRDHGDRDHDHGDHGRDDGDRDDSDHGDGDHGDHDGDDDHGDDDRGDHGHGDHGHGWSDRGHRGWWG